MKTREIIELDSAAIERGYKTCKSARKFFRDQAHVFNNLPGDQRRAVDALGFHTMKCIDMLDLTSPNQLPLDVWGEVRDEVSDAFLDQCASVDLAALVDSCRRFDVPKQFLFDQLEAADTFVRFREFETWDELLAFSCRLGGSAMAAAAHVLAPIKPGFEIPALKTGQAILLTQMLSRAHVDLKQNKNFFAKEDLEDCGVVVNRIKVKQIDKPFTHLVRLYCSRIEKLFHEASHFANLLDFDGNRSVKSLLELYWPMLMKMRVDPESILNEDGVLSKRELLMVKSRHLMGLQSQLPIVAKDDDHHGH